MHHLISNVIDVPNRTFFPRSDVLPQIGLILSLFTYFFRDRTSPGPHMKKIGLEDVRLDSYVQVCQISKKVL